MMIKIEKPRQIFRTADGTPAAVFDLHVGSANDLPQLGDLLDGMAVQATSIAVDKTGIWYKLHTDGEWYLQDGSGDTAGGDTPNALTNADPNRSSGGESEPPAEREEPALKEDEPEPEPEEPAPEEKAENQEEPPAEEYPDTDFEKPVRWE